MNLVHVLCFAGLAVAGAMLLWALIRNRSIFDRLIALDTILLTVVAGIGVGAAATGRGTFLDALVITALVGFVGIASVSRFIDRGSPPE